MEKPAAPVVEPEAEPARLEKNVALVAETPPPPPEEEGAPVFDEAAESAFRAEARDRGEVVVARVAASEPEDTDTKALPSLDSLVQRIPAEVRETLDDLFRARFVRVQRVPRRLLKK